MSNIPLEVQLIMQTTLAWLWANYGKRAVERAGKKVADEAQWTSGMGKYMDSLYERVGWVRILGRHEAVPLENVFTHVNLLDKILAERRYDVAKLREEFDPRAFDWHTRVKRVSGDAAVDGHHRLFILGKPGAGKTTFLKHTALRTIRGEKQGVPIFVSLHELAESDKGFEEWIAHQLEVHGVPEAAGLAASLLEGGDALVLLDGLDEVTVGDEKRAKLIAALNDFIYRYAKCPMVMTCRVAASDYSFTQFTYAEMADFDDAQITRYIEQWFADDPTRSAQCRSELFREENKPVRELAQVPLLLSMLCLTYEELGEFPPNRAEIYEEATRALLVKWDSSRNIRRDDVYKQLSLKRKQDLLAHLAYENFVRGDYFLQERPLVRRIEAYLGGVPGLEEPDGQVALQAMEAQHGILVERAHRIHSFAHLTFQEYFTACWIADNEARDALTELIRHVGDERWNEIFLLVAARLPDASEFVRRYRAALDRMIVGDPQLVRCLAWCEEKRRQVQPPYKAAAARAFVLSSVRDRTLAFDRAIGRARVSAHPLDHNDDLALGLTVARAIDHDLALALARAIDHNLALDHNLNHIYALALTLERALTKDLAFNLDLDLDLDLARVFARASNLVQEWACSHQQSGFEEALATLQPPTLKDRQSWQTFAARFVGVMEQFAHLWNLYRKVPIQREAMAQQWNLSSEREEQLDTYLQATDLLLRCMKLAYLPEATRREIEEGLLLPPP